jgi:HAD superfamily hydrolase (TIGR01549 family)
MKCIDAILFDWDGTLIDSSLASFTAFQRVCRDLGISLGSEQYEKIYSPDWRSMYQALAIPPHKWDEADNLWIYYYGMETPPMVEGGSRALEEFTEKYCLGVVTSGSRARVCREIGAFGLDKYFQTVISGDDVINRKPHPEGLLVAMQRIRKQPQVCCYVGDSPEDVEMGKRAGVWTVGIHSRYPGSKRLAGAQPDLCIGSMVDLLEAFNDGRQTFQPA